MNQIGVPASRLSTDWWAVIAAFAATILIKLGVLHVGW